MDFEKLSKQEQLDAERAANLLANSEINKRQSPRYYTFEEASFLLHINDIKKVKETIRNISFKYGFRIEWLHGDNGTIYDFSIKKTK